MARALAFLYGAGAVLAGSTVFLPHPASLDEVGVAIPPALAVFVSAGLLWAGGRTPVWVFHTVLALGTALITQCVWFGGEQAGAYALMYLWVALYAGYFFLAREAVAHVVFAGILYGVALARADIPGPEASWLMTVGTIGVGSALVAYLTKAIREHAADLAAVAEMANGLSDVSEFGRVTCEGLQQSVRADVVIMLEPVNAGTGLTAVAMTGPPEAGLLLRTPAARSAMQAAFKTGRAQTILIGTPVQGPRRFRGTVAGLAQPILRDGRASGVLALAWASPRRGLSERVSTVTLLFAAEASVASERAERRNRDRERAALEINDNIVQGLVVAKYLAAAGNIEKAIEAIDETLGRARELITDQLEEVGRGGGRIAPGDLARREPSRVGKRRTA